MGTLSAYNFIIFIPKKVNLYKFAMKEITDKEIKHTIVIHIRLTHKYIYNKKYLLKTIIVEANRALLSLKKGSGIVMGSK